jgi:hypothetical protein
MIGIGWLEMGPQKLILLYVTLYLFSDKALQPKRLNQFARTMAQTTRFVVGKYLSGVALIENNISVSKPLEKPKFLNRDAKFQAK